MLSPVDRPTRYRSVRTTVIALLLAAVAGSPAVSGDLARAVRYRDLDLTSPDGLRELRRRMRWAADYLCRRQEEGDPLIRLEGRDCRQAVLDRAGPQVRRAIESAERDASDHTGGRLAPR